MGSMPMRTKRIGLIAAAMLLIAATHATELQIDDGALKPEDVDLREQLAQRMKEISSDPVALKEAIYYGELRASLCKVCHGEDGNSVREGSPNLAGQDPVYIVDQFNRYGDGRRIDYWMGNLSRNFSDDDKIKLAIYYSVQKTNAARGGDPAMLTHGEGLYRQYCMECHGEGGRSEKGYARLAGQRPEYTAKMIKEFQTAEGRRFNPLMYGRANMLKTDEDIQAVATYLAHLE